MRHNWFKKAAALVLAASFAASAVACGGSTAETTNGADSAETTAKADDAAETTAAEGGNEGISEDSPYANMGYDLSEHRDMVFYALSDRPTDMDEVLEVLNTEYLEPWLNVTLSVEFLPWGVASEKYPLLLSGSDPIDMIYTASWMGYSGYASQGAFVELTDDMLQEYMPYSYADQPEISWKQATVGGGIYDITPDAMAQPGSYSDGMVSSLGS